MAICTAHVLNINAGGNKYLCTPLPWQQTVSVGVINPMQGEYNINWKLWLSILAQHSA